MFRPSKAWRRKRYHSLLAIATSVVIAGAGLLAVPGAANAATCADFAKIRAKIDNFLTGGDYSLTDPKLRARAAKVATDAQASWDTLNRDPDREYLWADQQFIPNLGMNGNLYIQKTFERLEGMALAYRVKGSYLRGNRRLRNDIIDSLDWLTTNWYNMTNPLWSNWYTWQIGVPMPLTDMTILMYRQLTPQQRAAYMDPVQRMAGNIRLNDGANTAWGVSIEIAHAVITNDEAKMEYARGHIPELLQYQTTMNQDGFFADGSYIGHRTIAYNNGYGAYYLDTVSNVIYFLNASPWKVDASDTGNLVRWAFDSYVPLIYKAATFNFTRGRELSREGGSDLILGYLDMRILLKVAESAPAAADGYKLRQLVKEWLLSEPSGEFYDYSSLFSCAQAVSVLNDASITRAGGQTLYKQYSIMDKTAAQRPDWAFGVSAYSTRTQNYENVNGENKRGWHTSDGMTYLYEAGDMGQYNGSYWVTVDSHRLPGTTVVAGSEPGPSRGTVNLVGGTDLDGAYGVTGMDLRPPGQTLHAKKSWFVFDDEIVALGANISSTDGKDIETVVDNRKLDAAGDNPLVVDGTVQPADLGWSESMTGVRWMNLQGASDGSNVGYYFPTATTVQALREARSGTWSDITDEPNADKTTVHTDRYATFLVDHGANISGKSYAYVTLPNSSAEQTAAYAARPDTVVLANDADVQAVKDDPLGMIGAIFWNDGLHGVTVGAGHPNFITSDMKAAVMTKETADDITVSVSDPMMTNTGVIHIEIKRPATGVISVDPGVTVDQLGPTIKLTVDVNGARGKAFHVKLASPQP